MPKISYIITMLMNLPNYRIDSDLIGHSLSVSLQTLKK